MVNISPFLYLVVHYFFSNFYDYSSLESLLTMTCMDLVHDYTGKFSRFPRRIVCLCHLYI
jgi:hypothetical protein